jgi:hypothetical protein
VLPTAPTKPAVMPVVRAGELTGVLATMRGAGGRRGLLVRIVGALKGWLPSPRVWPDTPP